MFDVASVKKLVYVALTVPSTSWLMLPPASACLVAAEIEIRLVAAEIEIRTGPNVIAICDECNLDVDLC